MSVAILDDLGPAVTDGFDDGGSQVHIVCCDAAVALCGDSLTGADDYTDEAASCVLCEVIAELEKPCGAPGCEVGLEPMLVALMDEFAAPGSCRACGSPWVPDPSHEGQLCSACAASVGPSEAREDGRD